MRFIAYPLPSGVLTSFSAALLGVAFISLCSVLSTPAAAQVPVTQATPLSPPINHESGRIEEVLTAADEGFRFRGYVLTWRSMRIVVAGSPDESYASGDNLDVVVYRTEIGGHKVLRFEAGQAASNDSIAAHESASASASITLGTARIDATVTAELEGYRFVGYFVNWHDKRVFVADPQSAPIRAIGDAIDFRVLRTGFGTGQRLSFSL